MFCGNCGKEIDDSASFCRYCGAKTVEETKVENDNVQNSKKSDNSVFNLKGNSGDNVYDNIVRIINIAVIAFALVNIIAYFLPIFNGKGNTLMDCIKRGKSDEDYKSFMCYGIALIATILSVIVIIEKFVPKINLWFLSIVVGALDFVWYFGHTKWIPYGKTRKLIVGSGWGTTFYLICGCAMLLFGTLSVVMAVRIKKYKEEKAYYERKASDEGRSKLNVLQ